jgi:hypothetical protein
MFSPFLGTTGLGQNSVLVRRANASQPPAKLGWNVVTALEARENRGLQVA